MDKESALAELHAALTAPNQNDRSSDETDDERENEISVALWKAIIDFEGYPFTTSGRGSRPGIKFTYEVSKPTTGGGRRYAGVQVEGYGNELWITTLQDKVTTATDKVTALSNKVRKKKSISRSTVDLALKNALEEQEREGFVSGPRKLNVPGAGSYLYSLFLRFGVITSTDSSALGDGM